MQPNALLITETNNIGVVGDILNINTPEATAEDVENKGRVFHICPLAIEEPMVTGFILGVVTPQAFCTVFNIDKKEYDFKIKNDDDELVVWE